MSEKLEIPGYRIEHVLGKGAMGTVYLAEQLSLGRPVALKILKLAEDDQRNPELEIRFKREGQALARLNHSHIVALYSVGVEPAYYIAMEYATGGTLADRIQPGGMEPRRALLILKAVVDALGYMHKKNMVHRDLKPRNILFRDNENPLLADFGITKLLDERTITRADARMGSPAYMSPEQVRGKAVDARADLYSLGIVFYETLTGNKPFDAPGSGSDAAIQILRQHLTYPVPKLPEPLHALQPLLEKLLAKEPQHRYQTADEVITEINKLLGCPSLSAARQLTEAPTVAIPTLSPETLATHTRSSPPQTTSVNTVPTPTAAPLAPTVAMPALLTPVVRATPAAMPTPSAGTPVTSAARSLQGHTGDVLAVAFSPDGRKALSAGRNGLLKLWDLEQQAPLQQFIGHSGDVLAVAFSPDGRRALSGASRGELKLWEVATGQELLPLQGHTGDVLAVAFSPDGHKALSGGRDGELKLWTLA